MFGLKYMFAVPIITAVITGCASGPKYSEVASTIPTLEPSAGRIFFYRDRNIAGSAIQGPIYLNGMVVGYSSPGGVFYVDGKPGNYRVSCTTGKTRHLTFNLDAGETVYVETNVLPGLLTSYISPDLVDAEQARKEIKNLRYTAQTKPIVATPSPQRTSQEPTLRVTGETIATNTLQKDTLSNITIFVLASGCNHIDAVHARIIHTSPDIKADTRGVLVAGEVQEAWAISYCGKVKDYPVTFVPDGRGGTHFKVVDAPKSQIDASLSGHIAMVSGQDDNYEIYAVNLENFTVTRMTKTEAKELWPAWSPNAQQIAFASSRSGNLDIYVMNSDGSEVKNLTQHPADDGFPSWSPDGSMLAFASKRGDVSELFVMKADGSDVHQVTTGGMDISFVAWSPVADQIAFVADKGGNSEIYLIDQDGSNLRNLTNSQFGDWAPAWSPDGGQLVFVSDRDGNFELYLMDNDGSNVVRLTHSASNELAPCWSPDGDNIAFSTMEGNIAHHHVMTRSGSHVRRLLGVNGAKVESVIRKLKGCAWAQ